MLHGSCLDLVSLLKARHEAAENEPCGFALRADQYRREKKADVA